MPDSSQDSVDPQAQIYVSVAPDYAADVQGVADRLRAAGMSVNHTLEGGGVVTGSAPESRIADLERVEGVAAVEQARTYQLPPPDSPIQ
jgi:hypothetical protein